MNMKQFKYVLVLANCGSFSDAADELGISQPSLSQYIKKIEQQVGMELFNRTGGNVRLTDAGKTYIEIGRKILNLEHQLEEKFNDLNTYKSGTITVGVSAHRSVSLMPDIVRKFHEKYPGVIIHIEEKKRCEIINAAEHGEFDICLTTLPVDNKKFDYETVLVEENVIAVPKSITMNSKRIPGRKFPAISAKSLDGMNFAMLNKEHLMQRELVSLCDEYALTLNETVVCTSLESLVEMVKVGMGMAFIPSCIATPSPDVQYFSIEEETTKREIVLMHRKEQYLSHIVTELMLTIKDVLAMK